MANKSWTFTVVYQSPEDADLTPAKRREESIQVASTSAKRALSKAVREICDDWDGLEAKDVLVLDVFRTQRYEEV
jgi:hypothetical protein